MAIAIACSGFCKFKELHPKLFEYGRVAKEQLNALAKSKSSTTANGTEGTHEAGRGGKSEDGTGSLEEKINAACHGMIEDAEHAGQETCSKRSV